MHLKLCFFAVRTVDLSSFHELGLCLVYVNLQPLIVVLCGTVCCSEPSLYVRLFADFCQEAKDIFVLTAVTASKERINRIIFTIKWTH